MKREEVGRGGGGGWLKGTSRKPTKMGKEAKKRRRRGRRDKGGREKEKMEKSEAEGMAAAATGWDGIGGGEAGSESLEGWVEAG